VAHDAGEQPHARRLVENAEFVVEAVTLDHRTPTLAYVVREKPRRNIDPSRLAALGLRPGPWLKQLKDFSSPSDCVVIEGVPHAMAELRQALVVETPGDSLAYLTDFLLDEPTLERLSETLKGCGTLICEGQYRQADLALARKHYHMTTVLSATLAQRAGARELVLFHLSERYQAEEWIEMLREAREVFPNTHYPPQWSLGGNA
jgi:ribonuclease Z